METQSCTHVPTHKRWTNLRDFSGYKCPQVEKWSSEMVSYILSMYIVCQWVHGGQRRTSGILLHHFPKYTLGTESSVELGARLMDTKSM